MTTNIGTENMSKYEMRTMMEMVRNAWLERISNNCPIVLLLLFLSSISLQLGKKQESEEKEVIRIEEAMLRYATVWWLKEILLILCESYKTSAFVSAAPALIIYPCQITCMLASRDPSMRLTRSTVFTVGHELEERIRRDEARGISGARGLTEIINKKMSKLK